MQKIDIRSLLQNQSLFKENGYINGNWVPSKTTFDVTNPATDELIATVANLTTQDAEQAIKAAEDALPTWRNKTGKERAIILRKWLISLLKILKI